MTSTSTILHLTCGKIAAGKSTLAARLADAPGTVLLREDQLLHCLYPDEISSLTDYARCAGRLRDAIGPHIRDLLRAGVSVVLDFPANTRQTRAWMRSLLDGTGAEQRLHFLDVPDDVCRARLRARNAAGTHEYAASDADFDLFSRYFTAPEADEGFTVIRHRAGSPDGRSA